jgi:hypothetical protein
VTATVASAFAATMSFSKASSRLKRPVFSVITPLFSRVELPSGYYGLLFLDEQRHLLPSEMTGITGAKARPPVRTSQTGQISPSKPPNISALRTGGIEPDPIIDLGDVIPGFRIVFFREREGNILELMEGYWDGER